MTDLTGPEIILALSPDPHSGPSLGASMNRKDDMLLKLLDELIRAWMATHTPIEIGSDLEKVRVLKEARAAITEGAPSELVQQLYKEVFLRDVWSGHGRGFEGGAA